MRRMNLGIKATKQSHSYDHIKLKCKFVCNVWSNMKRHIAKIYYFQHI